MGESSAEQGLYQLSVTSKIRLNQNILICFKRCNFNFLPVECAHLKNIATFLLKPNPYVELFLDSKLVKKTDVVKCTYQPKWNEKFTMYVYGIQRSNRS